MSNHIILKSVFDACTFKCNANLHACVKILILEIVKFSYNALFNIMMSQSLIFLSSKLSFILAASLGKKVAVLDYVQPSPQGQIFKVVPRLYNWVVLKVNVILGCTVPLNLLLQHAVSYNVCYLPVLVMFQAVHGVWGAPASMLAAFRRS